MTMEKPWKTQPFASMYLLFFNGTFSMLVTLVTPQGPGGVRPGFFALLPWRLLGWWVKQTNTAMMKNIKHQHDNRLNMKAIIMNMTNMMNIMNAIQQQINNIIQYQQYHYADKQKSNLDDHHVCLCGHELLRYSSAALQSEARAFLSLRPPHIARAPSETQQSYKIRGCSMTWCLRYTMQLQWGSLRSRWF